MFTWLILIKNKKLYIFKYKIFNLFFMGVGHLVVVVTCEVEDLEVEVDCGVLACSKQVAEQIEDPDSFLG